MQQEIEESYLEIKKRIFQNETLQIKEDLIWERRDFIIKFYEESQGKNLPLKIQEIYQEKPVLETNPKGKQAPAKKEPKD